MSFNDPTPALELIRSAEPLVTRALRAAQRWDLADADGNPVERRADAEEAQEAAEEAISRLVVAWIALSEELAEVRSRDGQRQESAVEQQALI